MTPPPESPRHRVIVTRRLPREVEAMVAERFDATFSRDDQPLGSAGLQPALGAADGILCTLGDRFTAEVLAAHPIRTRVIANFGAGVDHIDVGAARAHGIVVTNTPGVLTDDTADIAMALILATLRRAGEGERELRAGRWTGWRPTHLLGSRVTGRKLGIVGAGRIGRAVAQRAHHGFGMDVVMWGRSIPDETTLHSIGARATTSLEELLAECTIVSLHVPGGAATAGMIGARQLALMPSGSFLINTARGEVVDTDALVASLMAGHLAGAGLDVYPGEPEIDRRLLGMEQVVLLPHLGSATLEGRTEMGRLAIANLEAVLAGVDPVTPVS
ncbi:MAG TPA: D-glycerate dehydrogenase [Gemmatimonadales bacterium]|nr:D-glycerate dehydrogenase [Gemmatimonadales bacterium]